MDPPAVPPAEVLDRFNLRLGWRMGLPVDGYKDGIATVQNLDDVIIVQNRKGAVTAIDPVTGAVRSRRTVGQSYPITQPVGHNDSLLLISNGTRVFALDRATGGDLWNVNLPGSPSSAPTANTDSFYVCLSNGRLSAYAYPGETGPVPGSPSAGGGPSPRLGIGSAPRTPPTPSRSTNGNAAPARIRPRRRAEAVFDRRRSAPAWAVVPRRHRCKSPAGEPPLPAVKLTAADATPPSSAPRD